MNPTLERMLGGHPRMARLLRLADLITPEEHPESERLLRELFEGDRDSIQIEAKGETEMAGRCAGSHGGCQAQTACPILCWP
ncbi:MAG: hypothetical protein ABSE40_14150 [Candidatus Sulfotelmatobacter sp.]|jgi:hypothetical protein